MKRKLLVTSVIGCLALAIFGIAFLGMNEGTALFSQDGENEMYDGPEMAMALEIEKTRDLNLGYVPRERLLPAINAAAESRAEAMRQQRASATNRGDSTDAPQLLSWTERGPRSDSPGPFGNPRGALPASTGGRTRSILVDANDPTGKTVFSGSVGGGLWKTTDITASPATWVPINDFLSNLAISDLAQDPRAGSTNIMYMGTGEGYFNSDAIRGNGIFKSIDGGSTWAYLPSTSSFLYTYRVVVDNAGNVYAATRGAGLRRSTDGGATWTNITPSGVPTDVSELRLSSTGRMHAVFGSFNFGTNAYRFTDIPATVTSAAGWTAATTPFTVSPVRTELAVSGDTLYATPSNGSTGSASTNYQIPTIFKSVNGGVDWAATTTQPTAGWASQQGWYSQSIAINPNDPNQVIVGGLDLYRTDTGGAVWTKVSQWFGSVQQYVHADHHRIIWYDNGNKILFGNDGGVFYSGDAGLTIRDRNVGLRTKQFYSVAIRPEAGSDYFLAGAQDNGTHAISTPGLTSSIEVTGGDGAFVAIDQDNGNNQFGAYVYNQYRYSTDGGTNWTNKNLSTGAIGRFINPFELDSASNTIYAANAAGQMTRWVNAPTGAQSTVTVTGLSGQISALTASPFTANRLLLGTGTGTAYRVDDASTTATPTATSIGTGLPAGAYISNIAYGTTENNLILSITNYGTNNVWITANGGTNWTPVDGNLPDMPVRWAIYKAGTDTGAIIGTEVGVWETDNLNGAATVWTADPTFPAVRVDMLRYRPSDGLIAAGTHGRGIWSTVPVLAANVSISGRVMASEDSRGLTNAVVTLTNPDGTTRTAITGRLGAFRFDDVPAGATYTVSVSARRYNFVPQTVTVSDSITNLNFYPTSAMRDR